jgi:site-specific DNA-methyltransferase (adenine-specific)
MKNKIIIGDATFILDDCINAMKDMGENSVDLCLTDPPYGINEAAGKNKSRNKPFGSKVLKMEAIHAKDYGCDDWDKERPKKEIFQLILKISNNQIIFGGNYFSDLLPASNCWIVWDKDNGKSHFADCELIYTSFKSAVRMKKYRWNGMLKQPGEKKDFRVHPTQKPVKLIQWILDKYSDKKDLIFDPFMGSGTTAIACYRTGRKFIGIEKEKKYFDIAVERYRNEVKQLRLPFDKPVEKKQYKQMDL